MQFPPNFATGDVSSKDLDIKLPNHVYNVLKLHSKKEEKHSHKILEKKEHSTHVSKPLNFLMNIMDHIII